jgi:hypothetical protein
MSDGLHRVSTTEERDRFNAARSRGGLCAACGRTLGEDEPVYIGSVLLDRAAFGGPGVRWERDAVPRDAPLGVECASPSFLARMERREPERCQYCDRPVYYAKDRPGRQRASCSTRCKTRADTADRSVR